VAGGTAVVLVFYRGDAEGSARLANNELEFLLQPGEVVERRVPVVQRHWWHFFRVTHGVLAVTDRRILYVGVPPAEVLTREPEPQEFIELSLPFERPIDVQRERVIFGTTAGVAVRSGARSGAFGVRSADRAKLDSAIAVVERRQAGLRAAQEAEQRAREAAVAASRRAIYHLVRRGEALEVIATRYGTTVDSLRIWNDLTSDRITAGRRLLVRPEVK
jgi:hypothetical protein